MSNVPGILGTIDGALRDCSVSSDAMRWAPGGEREAEPGHAPADAPRIDLRGSSVVLNRPLAMRPGVLLNGLDPAARVPLLPVAGLSGSISGPLYPGAGDALAALVRTVAEALRPLLEWAAKTTHDFHRALCPHEHRRCLTCHAERKPKPLAVDGHEYRRRQLNRVKRRRH